MEENRRGTLDDFITLIIFALPGFISFTFLKLFGLYPSNQQKNNDLVMISSILWIPINVIVLGIHAIFIYFGRKCGFEFSYIYSFETLKASSNNLFFVLYYSAFSIIVAYLLALVISKHFYSYFLNKVNNIRNENGKASLSRYPTVWENTFTIDEAQIIKIKLGDKEYIGEIQRISSNTDKEKDILLRHQQHWTKILEEYEIEIESIYIDTKLNLVIEIYDRDQCIKAQDLYRKEMGEK